MLKLSPPELLTFEHILDDFNSGEPSLDHWIKKRSFKNQDRGVSRCFVVCKEKHVVGYYSLSAGAISREIVPKGMGRNMPDPLPVLLLGRLAVDCHYHNRGIGKALLRDALLRSLAIAQNTGVFAMLVHALSDNAKQFYLSRGFVECPVQPMTLMITLKTVKEILDESPVIS